MAMQTEVQQIQNYFRDRYGTKAALKSPPHITLIPPFELSSDRLESLQSELEKFAKTRSPFPINLSGFAAFPPRVIYIDVQANPTLQSLYVDITASLSNQLDIVDPYANRPFVPHMTVGFRDLTPDKFELAWAEFCDRSIELEFVPRKITLLVHDQQKWQALSNFTLQGT